MTAPTIDTRQDMLDKVRKLLAKAESVAGTPEADVFTAKAFELMSKYGIEEAEARQRRGEGPAPIDRSEFHLRGSYVKQQRTLLHNLAITLRCDTIGMSNNMLYAYGTAADRERLTVLFSALLPQMLAGSKKQIRGRASATTVARRSYMLGFISAVCDRLRGAEADAAAEADRETALVLLDDYARAQAALRSDFPRTREIKTRTRVDYSAHGAGSEHGSRVDVGGTRLRGQLALGR